MQIKATIGSVVGKTDDNHWGQICVLPHAYGIVEIEDSDGIARQTGVTLLTKITDALTKELTSLREVEEIADSLFIPQCKTMVLLVPVGRVIYLALRGEGMVFLKRGDDVAKLMFSAGGISGEIQEGDMVLLVSHEFTKSIAEEKLASVFDHLTAQDAAEKLTIMLHQASNGMGAAALVFEVSTLVSSESELLEDKTLAEQEGEHTHTVLGKTKKLTAVSHSVRRRLSTVRSSGKQFVAWTKNSRKNTAFVTSILILIFVTSVLLGIQKQMQTKKSRVLTNALAEARRAFDEGVALLELNPIKGRERLIQAKTTLEPIRAIVSERTREGREIAVLFGQINDNLSQSMHVVATEPVLFFDASLLKKGGQASFLTLSGDTMGIVDQQTKTVYAVSVPAKSGKIIAGGESYTGLSLISRHVDKTYVLTDKGVNLVRDSDNKTIEAVIKKDTEWGNVGALGAFGGNVYLLDTQKGRIWKYVALEKGFSELREYLNPDTLPDLSSATSMFIDGSVWVGTKTGRIFQFSQGKEKMFSAQGVEPALGAQLYVYTSDEAKNLYVLDSQNKRVVVLAKDGVYMAQYQWQGTLSPSQLVVSEAQKQILLLAEGKIYSVELK